MQPIVGKDYVMLSKQMMHPFHFQCFVCKCTLDARAKEFEGKLYCPRDYEHAQVPMCASCRRPIEGRVISALGKHFHPEHFVCARCEKPFSGEQFFEYKGQPYCAADYQEFVSVCFLCNKPTLDGALAASPRPAAVSCG